MQKYNYSYILFVSFFASGSVKQNLLDQLFGNTKYTCDRYLLGFSQLLFESVLKELCPKIRKDACIVIYPFFNLFIHLVFIHLLILPFVCMPVFAI